MTNLFVLTSPRPTADRFEYLKNTLGQIEAEGTLPCRKWLLYDGDEAGWAEIQTINETTDGHWSPIWYDRPAGTFAGGNKLPYFHILSLGAKLGRESRSDTLILEDDLDYCPNAVLRMLTLQVPSDVAWLQFFSAWTLTEPRMHPGLWRTPCGLQGLQAIKYPHRTLQLLTEWAGRDEFQKFNAGDSALQLAQRRLELRTACHCPDLVQHRGAESAVDAGTMKEGGINDAASVERAKNSLGGRVSVTWPGKTFDAMKLFARHELYL